MCFITSICMGARFGQFVVFAAGRKGKYFGLIEEVEIDVRMNEIT